MPKLFFQNTKDRSAFLTHSESDDGQGKQGERAATSPLRSARLIDIKRIQPDPNQPRKTFNQKTLESLAESIKELGGIIDPVTVEFEESEDIFRIINGERRYRAAKIAGLDELPCIVKEVNERERYLMQIVANLQREDIHPLEEAAIIKYLVETYGYTQRKVARLLNKSKSYVSEIVSLDRLSEQSKAKVLTSELSKEILIGASREKDPQKQLKILKQASEEGKTVRQIRREQKRNHKPKGNTSSDSKGLNKEPDQVASQVCKFREWSWEPEDKRFVARIQFRSGQNESKKH